VRDDSLTTMAGATTRRASAKTVTGDTSHHPMFIAGRNAAERVINELRQSLTP